MKRLFLFAAATAVALSSCSKDEVTATAADAQNEIKFSTYSAAATKAYSETTNSNLSSYTVEAVYTSGYASFASGIVVTNNNGTGSYDGTLYWPANTSTTLEFVAYSGVTYSTFDSDGADLTLSSHDGKADPVAAYATEQASNTATGAVTLTFKHLLSLIDTKITANTTDTSLNLVITDVTYTSIDGGTATVDNTNATTWTTTGANNLTSAVIASSTTVTGGNSDDTTATTITVIPQTISVVIKGQWEQDCVVIEDFTAGRTVSDLEVVAGTSYTFSFSITPDITAITFSAEVSEWSGDATYTSNQSVNN